MKRIGLILLLLILPLTLFCQVHWTKHPDNPVMVATEEWEGDYVLPRSVIYHDSIYHMWYWGAKYDNLGYPDYPFKEAIGYAISPDGINWTKDPNNPVLEPGPEGAWDDHIIHGCSVILHDSIFHMWYNGHSGQNIETNWGIGHATSPDGINWSKDTNNPVMVQGQVGEWDGLEIELNSVIHDGDNFKMWYDGIGYRDGLWCVRAGHSISPDGVNWMEDSLNPVLSPEYDWEGDMVFFLNTVFDGFNYKMWYAGGSDYNWQVGYATSDDGSVWEKHGHNPVLKTGPAGSWDQKHVGAGPVIDSAGVKYKMWYIGGQTDDSQRIGYAESPVPAWKQMEPMDSERGRLRSCVIDNMIYVFGGEGTNGVYIDSVDVYNTETNEWTDLSPMPTGLSETNVEVINDTIHIVGGWNSDNITLNTTVAYDPEGDNYFSKENTPMATGSNASCVLNDTLYILGGKEDGYSTDVKKGWVYDPVGNNWGSLPEMNYQHGVDGTASVIDDKIYVIGGGTGLTLPMDPVQAEVFDGEMWEAIEDMPIPVLHHISVVHDNKIFVFGGDSGAYSHIIGYATNLIQEYDPATNSWRQLHGMPFSRSAMTGEKVGNYLYLMGGYSSNDRVSSNAVSEVWKFNLDSLKAFISVSGISLDKQSLELHVSETATLVVTITPTDASAPSVSWTSSDAAVATVANGTVTGIAVGQTYIYVSSNDGQFMDSCQISITPGVGISNIKADRLSIYPNPTNNLLTIETEQPDQYSIEITSVNGQLLYSKEMEGTTHQIDLSSFQKGVYFITIRSDDFITMKKIIKL